jgi:uncharacterized tellurite resistance protein B-like protein
VLRSYQKNSPEALARIFAMVMLSDSEIDPSEIKTLKQQRAYALFHLEESSFTRVVEDYRADLSKTGQQDRRLELADRAAIDGAIELIDDLRKRLDAAAIILAVIRADGRVLPAELMLFNYILRHWGLTLDQVGCAADALEISNGGNPNQSIAT